MKKLLVVLGMFVLMPVAVVIADHLPLSPQATSAMPWFSSAESPLPPGFMVQGVSRRFASTNLTYRIMQPTGNMAVPARNAMRFYQALMNTGSNPVNMTITEVPATDNTATITFMYATSFNDPELGTIPIACAASPVEFEADNFTYKRAWILSNPKKGCDSQALMIHEAYHIFGAFWHTNTSNSVLQGVAAKNGCGGSCVGYKNSQTPEQNAAHPGWEPVAGFWEAMRWIYQHPAGTVIPPQ
jgi:hypothetical protein